MIALSPRGSREPSRQENQSDPGVEFGVPAMRSRGQLRPCDRSPSNAIVPSQWLVAPKHAIAQLRRDRQRARWMSLSG